MTPTPHQPSPLRSTERRNPRSAVLDLLDTVQLVDLFVAEDTRVPLAVGNARASIAAAMTLVEDAFRTGGRLTYVGAGTSGRLGVLDASECPPTFGTPPDLVQGVIAGGRDALIRSVEGAEDDPLAGARAMDTRGIGPHDVVVGIAASGTTPFVHGALEHAASLGARTVFFSCAEPPEQMVACCDVVIHVDVGPELVTGSTRLKAGTATKLVLNMLTTGAMVRIGKTWGNLMVDVQVTNTKLADRGERIVMEAVGATRIAAREAIAASGGRVRTAIVMLHRGVDAVTADAELERADRHLRPIVGDPPPVAESS